MPSDALDDAVILVVLMRVSGQTLAIRQRDVLEILPLPRLTPLPEAPPAALGAFRLGGELVLALRMAALLGLAGPAEDDPLYHHLLLLPEQRGDLRLALLIDRATDVAAARLAPVPRGESFNGCVDGEIGWRGAIVPMLAADRLLTAHEAARLAAFAARAAVREAAFAEPPPA